MHRAGMGRDVLAELLHQERMNPFGLIVWDLLVPEVCIELQGVTGRTVFRKFRRRHVGLFVGMARADFAQGSGIQFSAMWRDICALGPMAVIADQLHPRVVRPNQVRLQVQVVIESNPAGVGLSGT